MSVIDRAAKEFNGITDFRIEALDLSAESKVTISFFAAQSAWSYADPYGEIIDQGTTENLGVYVANAALYVDIGSYIFGHFPLPVSAREWHHYVVVLDRDDWPGGVRLWIDGVDRSGEFVLDSGSSPGGTFAAGPMFFGKDGGGHGGGNYWQGTLSLPAVWSGSETITTAEIGRLLKGERPVDVHPNGLLLEVDSW